MLNDNAAKVVQRPFLLCIGGGLRGLVCRGWRFDFHCNTLCRLGGRSPLFDADGRRLTRAPQRRSCYYQGADRMVKDEE